MNNWHVPLADLDLGQDEIEAVSDVLRSKWLSMGSITAAFEQRFAAYVGVQYAFAVTNCTAALHLAHLALGAGPGDTVICPSLTFVATANAIRYTGATPVFADIMGPNDLNIDPDAIEAQIDETTKGLCVVHYGGYPCNMDSIMHIAKRHNLYVVEDVAHAPGAACWMTVEQTSQAQRGKRLQKCGSIGDIGCFSFFSNKNMTTGEGGMLTTNDADLAERIRLLRSHGMTRLTWDRNQGHGFSYDVLALGYNYRIDEIRAAIGSIQLKKLEGNNHKRLEATNFYKETLSNIENMTIPFLDNQSLSSYHIFPILLKNRDKREQFMKFMCNKGIQTSIHYPPVHQFTSYRTSSSRCGLLRTEDIGQREVTLPLYAGIERQQLDYITTSIQEWMVATK